MLETRSERVAAMITPSLLKRVKDESNKKRWSVSFFIEEALLEKLAYDEKVKKS